MHHSKKERAPKRTFVAPALICHEKMSVLTADLIGSGIPT
jgi:hypothetical protein